MREAEECRRCPQELESQRNGSNTMLRIQSERERLNSLYIDVYNNVQKRALYRLGMCAVQAKGVNYKYIGLSPMG